MYRQDNAKSFHNTMIGFGFLPIEDGVAKDSSEVRVICSAGTSRKNCLASVTVGLWINTLSLEKAPQIFSYCHVYGSLGAVIPEFARLKVVEGHQDERAWKELVGASTAIAMKLSELLTITEIQKAYNSGRFDRCLIRKEARKFLELRR